MPLPGGTSELGMSDYKCEADLTSDCKCQADLMPYHFWPPDASTGGISELGMSDHEADLNSTSLGHQMPLPVGYIWLPVSMTQRITKCPYVVLLFVTRCLYLEVHLSMY